VNASMLRQLWSLIEEIQSSTLLKLSDAELVAQILQRLEAKKVLSTEDNNLVSDYIYSKTSLIRDLADENHY
jgi:ribosome assembly protein YihI (activator of Der GTPase)